MAPLPSTEDPAFRGASATRQPYTPPAAAAESGVEPAPNNWRQQQILNREQQMTVSLEPSGTRPAAPVAAPQGDTPEISHDTGPITAVGGLTLRGAFIAIVAPTVLACLFGFIRSGVVTIPAQTGWGLVVGSVIAATMAPRKLGLVPVWLPPLALLSVVVVLGQVTMLGSMPTIARETAMIFSSLTALAPAQLISVGLAAAIIVGRRRLSAV